MKTLLDSLSSLVTNQLFLGAVIGWAFTRLMEMLRNPKLNFELCDDKEFTRSGRTFKFINLEVENKKYNSLVKFFIGNTSLNNARVWLIFQDFSSKKEILKVNGRWASTKEPIDYSSGQPLIPEILLPSRDSIPPGESANISIAIKESGETSFFVFNNESYLHDWKNPDFELKDNKYWLKVRILADGIEYTDNFLISNPATGLKNFKLLNE